MRTLTREERFGLSISSVIHLILLVIAILMVSRPQAQDRYAFIEITLGEFQDGTLAEYSREETVQPETRPDPVETVTEEPQPEPAEEPQPEPVQEEPARDVDLPEQEQEVQEEPVTTPDTDVVDPTRLADQTEQVEEPAATPPAQQDEAEQQGDVEAGDIRGIRGRVDVDQGTETDPVRSAPFQLEWEGDINRAPIVQPLPDYVTETEAVISVRFEVRPDGTIGRLQPIIKAHPELEREVLRTLRTWRFSRLPSNLPQEPQFGTITFRFVLE
jgi:outer membrane biosynthesis protein TonB